jgi:hypothetical protein
MLVSEHNPGKEITADEDLASTRPACIQELRQLMSMHRVDEADLEDGALPSNLDDE